jgi:MFS transporter, DHA1 family, solute carrier family 18 (vesicular amine transporter), member 1/2
MAMSLRRSRAAAAALVTLGTFTDLLAYSIAVPVLPDLTGRLGATPATIGFLFASFGVTLLGVSIPMGVVSDRVGRRLPLVIGMAILAASTLLFAYSSTLPGLFAARLMQGAADAITWGVGFALIADVYEARERGRVMGLVMSGSNLGFMLGPSIGGWLYETGGPRLPFLLVTALAIVCLLGFLWLDLARPAAAHEPVPFRTLIRVPAIASCAVVVVAVSATFSMFEPIVALFLSTTLGQSPSRVGLVFGAAAVASAALHPLYGRLADRYGGVNLMLLGLVLAASVMPALAHVETYRGALSLFLVQAGLLSMVVTPSLAYMADASAKAGGASFGVSYGLYNFAWGCGLLGGPAIGGVLYEQVGFTMMMSFWPLLLLATAAWLAMARRAARPQTVATMNASKEIS